MDDYGNVSTTALVVRESVKGGGMTFVSLYGIHISCIDQTLVFVPYSSNQVS